LELITIIVRYKVKKKKLAKAKDAISEYVEEVKKNEPGTIEYKVFQDDDDISSFVHIMSFTDKNAKKIHEKTEHLKKLKKILVPMSKGKAEYTTLTVVKFIKSLQKTEETSKDLEHSHEPI
jgi:quinol monooxygenase YgiN